MQGTIPKNVDDYIAGFPADIRAKLEEVRATIRHAAPEAEETISYAMPAYKFHGPLVYFAGFQNHIGFYALPTGHSTFAKELARYKTGKGSVQFPLKEPVPVALIKKMVHFRVKENMEKAARKSKS